MARIAVRQVFAATTDELEQRVATNLAALPDEDFRAALRRNVAAGRVEQPLVDHLELVVFAA